MTICVLGVFLLNFFILILFQEYLKKKKQKPKELNEYTLQIGNYYLNIALIILRISTLCVHKIYTAFL